MLLIICEQTVPIVLKIIHMIDSCSFLTFRSLSVSLIMAPSVLLPGAVEEGIKKADKDYLVS